MMKERTVKMITKIQVEELVECIAEDDIDAIEDFLGYQITSDVLEDLDGHIMSIIEQMSDDELKPFLYHYGVI